LGEGLHFNFYLSEKRNENKTLYMHKKKKDEDEGRKEGTQKLHAKKSFHDLRMRTTINFLFQSL